MSEEELVIFDLVTRPGPRLTELEVKQVKRAARNLLASLKQHRLILDWKKTQQNRAAVQQTIRDVLSKELPESYDGWRKEKRGILYQHVYDSYEEASVNIYEKIG